LIAYFGAKGWLASPSSTPPCEAHVLFKTTWLTAPHPQEADSHLAPHLGVMASVAPLPCPTLLTHSFVLLMDNYRTPGLPPLCVSCGRVQPFSLFGSLCRPRDFRAAGVVGPFLKPPLLSRRPPSLVGKVLFMVPFLSFFFEILSRSLGETSGWSRTRVLDIFVPLKTPFY